MKAAFRASQGSRGLPQTRARRRAEDQNVQRSRHPLDDLSGLARIPHHRGQIALALKQAGLPLPDEIAINALWYSWYYGEKKYADK